MLSLQFMAEVWSGGEGFADWPLDSWCDTDNGRMRLELERETKRRVSGGRIIVVNIHT